MAVDLESLLSPDSGIDLRTAEVTDEVWQSMRIVAGRLLEEHVISTAEPVPVESIAMKAAGEVGTLFSNISDADVVAMGKRLLPELLDPFLRDELVDEYAASKERVREAGIALGVYKVEEPAEGEAE